MLSVAVDRSRGNAATVLRVGWDAVTRCAHATGYGHRSISTHAHRVEPAVINAQAGGLRDEARWEAWVGPEGRPEAKQHAGAATGSAMGVRLGPSLTLLAIVLPTGAVASRATVGRWVDRVPPGRGSCHTLMVPADRPMRKTGDCRAHGNLGRSGWENS